MTAAPNNRLCRKCRRFRPIRDLERRGRHYWCCEDAEDCAKAKAGKDQ